MAGKGKLPLVSAFGDKFCTFVQGGGFGCREDVEGLHKAQLAPLAGIAVGLSVLKDSPFNAELCLGC